MSEDAKIVLRDLGLVLHVPGAMALVSLPVPLSFGEAFAVYPLALTALLALGAGQALYWRFRGAGETRLSHGMVIAALGWLLVSLLGTLPFWGIAVELGLAAPAPAQEPTPTATVTAFRDPWNALFESVSGFTGTGLSVASRPSQLPRTLQWWRSFMEWIGGVGVIVLMLSILKPTRGAFRLYYSEGRTEKIFPSVASTVRTIWWIYLLYTSLSILALRRAGMGWWEALNHGMTAIATGGFSVSDGGMADYGLGVRLVLLPLMLAGAINFAAHYRLLRERRFSALMRGLQTRALWLCWAGGSLLLLLEMLLARLGPGWGGAPGSGSGWLEAVFQLTSALSTTGFQTSDLHAWSPTAQLLLSLAMILGGAAGSTAGGIKLIRLVILYKGLSWRFRRIALPPHALMRYALDGEVLDEAEAHRRVEAAGVLAALWAVTLWAGVLVLVHLVPEGFTLSDVILEVASAQGNVGLSVGITSPELPWPAKLTLMASMWMGRLEIIPVLILVRSALSGFPSFRRRKV